MNLPAEILIALVSAGVAILGYHFGRRKTAAEATNFEASGDLAQAQAFALLRTQVNEMEKTIITLRGRLDALEEQLEVKDATIKKLETRLNKILIYVSGLLRELDAKNIQYTKPEPGLLDTNPRIPKVEK